MRGPAAGFAPFTERRDDESGLLDLKGVVHCHSYLSHDSKGRIEDIAAACKNVGIDFVVMTDHQTPHSVARGRRGFVDQTLFVVGAEMRAPDGTLLAFPLRHYVRPKPTTAEIIADIHAQGGLAFVGHAERYATWTTDGLGGIEIVNLHAAAQAANKPELALKGLFMANRDLWYSLTDRPAQNLLRYDEQIRARGPMAAIAGNDAHENVKIFGPLGGTIGTYEELFKVLTTHVLAERCDEDAVVDAFRQGRTYVVFDLYRDGTGFQFFARRGAQRWLMGDSVASADQLELVVRCPDRGRLQLFCDGKIVQESRGSELVWNRPEPGMYRVEVLRPSGTPWIWSSAIRVEPEHVE